jgi:hypothetical protein
VFLVFGIPGEGQNTIGYASGDGVCNSGGMGTVINNQSTIVTASHVAGSCATTQNTLWVQVNGKWISYPLVNVPISPGPGPDEGDVVTLVLPSDLPSYVIPASVAMNHHFVPGQSVDVNYYTTLLNEEGKITGFELLSSTTVAKKGWGWRVDTAYGQQIMLEKTLPGGSSGAGVFYDGQLIGVNSYADNLNYTGTSIAPFCYWLGLVC